jgi:lipoprotein-releasing system permease protein
VSTSSGRATRAAESRYARFVASRFVRARRQGFVSLISVVSALGFTVGVGALIVVLALMTGFQDDFVSRILGANAHLVLFPADGSAVFSDYRERVRQMEELDSVAAAQPVVQGFGGIVGPSGSVQWSAINGIRPEDVGRVTGIGEEMVYGEMAALGEPTLSGRSAVVLGDDLAQRLGVFPGDAVRVIVPRPKLRPWGASIEQRTLEVVATFETGYHEYDTSWSFTTLEEGQDLFATGDGVHRIAARLEDIDRLEEAKREVADELGSGVVVRSVMDFNRAYFSALKLEKLYMSLALAMIVLVAALGVVSTLVLTVTQKVREIGVLVALGASRGGILRIFVFQGLAMGVLGTLAGTVAGVGLCVLLDTTQAIQLDPEVYYLDHLPFHVLPRDLVFVVATSLVVSLVATLYPAWRAASLDPVEALRGD